MEHPSTLPAAPQLPLPSPTQELAPHLQDTEQGRHSLEQPRPLLGQHTSRRQDSRQRPSGSSQESPPTSYLMRSIG